MIDSKRHLLEKIAAEGKATQLLDEELATAKTLEGDGLLFLVGLTAVVTPKGRRALKELEAKPKKGKPPFKNSEQLLVQFAMFEQQLKWRLR